MARPSHTLLFRSRRELVRADFIGGRAARLAVLERHARDEPLESVLKTPPGQTVWVLDDEFRTGTVEVPADFLRRSSGEQGEIVARAGESLTGHTADEVVVGWSRLGPGSGATFPLWMLAVRSAEYERIRREIQAAGANFGGLLHPSGLPHPLLTEATVPWRRVEIWPGVLVAVEGGSFRPPRRLILASERWQSDLAVWKSAGDPIAAREILLTRGTQSPLADTEPTWRLGDETRLLGWLTHWARYLADPAEAVPIIRTSRKRASSWRRLLVSLGFAACVGLGCLLHAAARTPVRAPAVSPVDVVERIEQQTLDLTTRAAQLRTKIQQHAAHQEALVARRGRLTRLLRVLAEQCPEDVAIQRIDGPADAPTLHGLCLSGRDARALMAALTRQLAGEWTVSVPILEPLTPANEGPVSTFRISLKPILEVENGP